VIDDNQFSMLGEKQTELIKSTTAAINAIIAMKRAYDNELFVKYLCSAEDYIVCGMMQSIHAAILIIEDDPRFQTSLAAQAIKMLDQSTVTCLRSINDRRELRGVEPIAPENIVA